MCVLGLSSDPFYAPQTRPIHLTRISKRLSKDAPHPRQKEKTTDSSNMSNRRCSAVLILCSVLLAEPRCRTGGVGEKKEEEKLGKLHNVTSHLLLNHELCSSSRKEVVLVAWLAWLFLETQKLTFTADFGLMLLGSLNTCLLKLVL